MKNRNKQTKFPVARIKKIMQKDEEVGKVAQATPVVISKALELFLGMLVDEAARVTRERNSKRVESYHLKHAIERTDMLDFLKEIVASVPDPSYGGTIDVESAQQAASRGAADRGDGGTSSFAVGVSGSGPGTGGAKRTRRATTTDKTGSASTGGRRGAAAAATAGGSGDGAPRRRRKKGDKAAAADADTDAVGTGAAEITMRVKDLSTSSRTPTSVSDGRGGFSASSYMDDYDYEPSGPAEGSMDEHHHAHGTWSSELDRGNRASAIHNHDHGQRSTVDHEYGEGEPEVETDADENEGGDEGGRRRHGAATDENDEWK